MGSVHRRTGSHSWEGVKPVGYDDPAVAGVEKHELIGAAEGARDYRIRYFHVPAGDAPPASVIPTIMAW
jgi:hypothetical protein